MTDDPIVSDIVSSADDDDTIAAVFRAVATTQFVRYLNITMWALLLLTVSSPLVVVFWYLLTMVAGIARSTVEKRMRAAGISKQSRWRYAVVAMVSCSFWATAPIIACTSGHPAGPMIAIFLIANGCMLAFSQFNATPIWALVATSPYFGAYGYCLSITAGDAIFWATLMALPLFMTTVGTVLLFGYVSHRQLVEAGRERKRLIEQLDAARVTAEQASEAKSMFLANMSHEIRTPMNGVLGMAELLANTRLDSRQRIFADTIYKSGAALLTIINDILDFSKIEAGKLELEQTSFDLRTSIEDVAALMASRAQEKELELIVRFQPDLPPNLIGDGGRLRQVVTNLVANAVKFTSSGHVLINVSGSASTDTVSYKIEVTDTGVGIPEETLLKIFDAFQQADTSTTRKFGGTGLGLSISKRLVEAMGGKIDVRSTLGEGSTFWVELEMPISDEEEIEWQSAFEIEGQRALIVDDNDVNRQILEEQLSAWGFAPTVASSAKEALVLLRTAANRNEQFDVAILDFFMPEMDGEELAQTIKSDAVLADVPLMILTSVDRAGDANRFKQIGVSGYLVKPARSVLLYETLVGILRTDPTVGENDIVVEPITDMMLLPPTEKLRILLAEDNEVNQLVIKHMINPNLVDLVIANNGFEAVAAFKAHSDGFDLILMDVSMPEMDGYEATRQIREAENELERHTPIICLTAHVMKDDIERSHAVGMDDYLSKPVTKERLDNAIDLWSSRDRTGGNDAVAV